MSSQSANLREEDSFFSRKYIDFREKKIAGNIFRANKQYGRVRRLFAN